MSEYAFFIIPLSEEDGGGYAAIFPDLPGCMSDGETPEEALVNGQDAMKAWLSVQKERGVEIPAPGSSKDRFKARNKRLMDAVKLLLDFTEFAETRIPELEAALEEAVEQLSNDWSPNSALLSHAAAKHKPLISKH